MPNYPPDMFRQVAELIRDARWLRQRAQILTPGPWQPLGLVATGAAVAAGFYTPAARIVGDVVELSGAMTATSMTNNTVIANLPAGANMAPASTVRGPVAANSGPAMISIGTGGGIFIFVSAAVTAVYFDSFSFRLT